MIMTLSLKQNTLKDFLKEGDKVKAYVQFKGRAIMFKNVVNCCY